MVRIRSGRRRVAIGLLVLSCVALVATSPVEVESLLTATASDSVQLTIDDPRAAGRIQLSLSAAALPVIEQPLYEPFGEVRFRLPREDEGIVAVVRPVGVEAVPYEQYDTLIFPIEQLCRVAEPCEREFEVTLEWAEPREEIPTTAAYTAELEITYPEVEHNPDGASATWATTADLLAAPAGPLVSATTDREPVVLDDDAWAAARHVTITASEAARTGELLARVDWEVTQAQQSNVLVTIVPDEATLSELEDGILRDPFVGCPADGACERGFTVTFELEGAPMGTSAVVGWTGELRAAFPAEAAPPGGARVSIDVDGTTAVTTTTPALSAAASGSLVIPGPDASPTAEQAAPAPGLARRASVRVTVEANAAALPIDELGTPFALSRVVLIADSSAIRGNADISVVTDDGRPMAVAKVSPGGPGASVTLNPLRSCARGAPCERSVTITLTVYQASEESGEPMEVDWSLDAVIPYPDLDAVPDGASLDLTVEPGG